MFKEYNFKGTLIINPINKVLLHIASFNKNTFILKEGNNSFLKYINTYFQYGPKV